MKDGEWEWREYNVMNVRWCGEWITRFIAGIEVEWMSGEVDMSYQVSLYLWWEELGKECKLCDAKKICVGCSKA